MIKDRGTMKWTAMMLPEHVKMLREVWKVDNKVSKPTLDNQAMEQIEHVIKKAYNYRKELAITFWIDGEFKIIVGKIYRLNIESKTIRIEDKFEDRKTIPFSEVIDARIM